MNSCIPTGKLYQMVEILQQNQMDFLQCVTAFSFLKRKEIMRKFEGLSCVLQEGYRLCRYHHILYTERCLQKTSVVVLNGNKLRYYSEPLYLHTKKF